MRNISQLVHASQQNITFPIAQYDHIGTMMRHAPHNFTRTTVQMAQVEFHQLHRVAGVELVVRDEEFMGTVAYLGVAGFCECGEVCDEMFQDVVAPCRSVVELAEDVEEVDAVVVWG